MPVAAIPDFIARATPVVQALVPGVRPVSFGHLGDGNLHYNVQAPEGVDSAVFLETSEATINTLVFDAVNAFGGSISAEHGIGIDKIDELAHYRSKIELDTMRSIKRALDPKNIMNPGKIFLM